MNLLIVDDQVSVLNGLLNGVHFNELGFTSVDTAMSANDALQILEQKPIHILLTDIEMPGRNGLELNSIVREKYPDVLRIVLTSHAVFFYAQTSIKLGCFDYIVQPAPFEDIEASLKRAIDAVNLNHNNRRINEYGHLFKSHESEFMTAAIQKLYSNDPDDITSCIQLLNQSGYPISQNSMAQFIFIDVFAYTYREPDYPSQHRIMDAISCAAQAIPFAEGIEPLVTLNPHRQFSILLMERSHAVLPVDKSSVSLFYDALCKELSSSPIACYVGDSFVFSDVHLAIKAANDHIKNNVAKEACLSFIAQDELISNLGSSLPDHQKHWSKLLYSGQKSLLKKDIDFCLDTKIDDSPNPFQGLCDLHQQLIQLFFRYFYDNGIDINSLFTEEFTYRDCMDGFANIEDVKKTVDFLLDATETQVDRPQELDYVEKAKVFISENYNQLLSVREVAEHVHLNPEYFTRLFKKETGQNIKNYIVECKMMMAKDLLKNSNLPVSMVALEVGYSNFSHFTQIFRRIENVTPSEYRLRVTGKSE